MRFLFGTCHEFAGKVFHFPSFASLSLASCAWRENISQTLSDRYLLFSKSELTSPLYLIYFQYCLQYCRQYYIQTNGAGLLDTLNTTSRVLETLREKIIISHLKPGYKLNEIDISEDLGISRPPLREALRILEKDNMVVNVPRKGTYVSELSLKDFIEVSQTREMIECYCVDLLKASNIRSLPEVESALRKASELPSPFISSDEAESIRHIRVMRDFHVRLVESTGNSLLSRIYSSIGYTLARYQYIYFHIDDAVRQSLDDHARFLELIREGSFDKAKEELRKHINYTVELVKNRIIHRAVF